MPENIDDAKGQLKEKAGQLTDDEELEREGKVDQASGSVKEKAEDAKDKAEGAVDKIADKVKGALRRD